MFIVIVTHEKRAVGMEMRTKRIQLVPTRLKSKRAKKEKPVRTIEAIHTECAADKL